MFRVTPTRAHQFTFVHPLHRALLAVHVHPLALGLLVARVAQRRRDQAGQLHLVLHGRMQAVREERGRREHFAWRCGGGRWSLWENDDSIGIVALVLVGVKSDLAIVFAAVFLGILLSIFLSVSERGG